MNEKSEKNSLKVCFVCHNCKMFENNMFKYVMHGKNRNMEKYPVKISELKEIFISDFNCGHSKKWVGNKLNKVLNVI